MELGGHAFQCTRVRFLALTDDQLLLAHFNNCVGWALPTIPCWAGAAIERTNRIKRQDDECEGNPLSSSLLMAPRSQTESVKSFNLFNWGTSQRLMCAMKPQSDNCQKTLTF